jgi:hypothetical protein
MARQQGLLVLLFGVSATGIDRESMRLAASLLSKPKPIARQQARVSRPSSSGEKRMISVDRFIGPCKLALFVSFGAVLSSCGGGGGGGSDTPSGPSFSVSPASLSFSALAGAAAPLSQQVTVTTTGVTSGTLYFRVTLPGVVSSVSSVSITGPNTGQAFVVPVAPSSLGPGTHTGTISIVACTTDVNCSGALLGGSPQTIAVTYTVASSLQGDAVAPHVVTAGVPGEVVIRGAGIAATTAVSFGANSATSFSQVSATEIRAGYPATLTAGTYAVQLQNASGPTAFSGNLVAVAPPGYPAATLAYPSSPGNFRSVIYDAARQAILVATDTQLLRYAYSGAAWQAPTQLAISDLRDIALSVDGTSLLALTSGSMGHHDPVTLVQNAGTAGGVPGAGPPSHERLAVANDGIALVSESQFGLALYPTKNPAFHGAETGYLVYGALPAASGNGSLVAFIQGQLSPAPAALVYRSSSGSLTTSSVRLNRISVNSLDLDPAPSVDRSGTRIAVNSSAGDYTGINVFDADWSLRGALPGTTAAVAFAPNPAGAAVRAYTLDACKLRAFDLAAPLVSGAFVEIVTAPYPITLAGCPGNHPRVIVTPDGGNAIVAGDQQVVIVPTP